MIGIFFSDELDLNPTIRTLSYERETDRASPKTNVLKCKEASSDRRWIVQKDRERENFKL